MSNFTFLKREWPELYDWAVKVESLAMSDPRSACFYARFALERSVAWLYTHDGAFSKPYDSALASLIAEPSFRANVPENVYQKIELIRREGNAAVHQTRPVHQYTALNVTKEVWHVLYWVARTYSRDGAKSVEGLQFDQAAVQAIRSSAPVENITALRKQSEELEAKNRELLEQSTALRDALVKKNQALSEQEAEIVRLQAAIEEIKHENAKRKDTHDYSEAETRDRFIDLMLREAGWEVANKEDQEYTCSAGRIDYVLWGDDGKPLAVVEAKRTKRDPRAGQQQALDYADALEQEKGQRPLIFYTNGYETWFWDDKMYPPRAVHGFYTKQELEYKIRQRDLRQPLKGAEIMPQIIDRYYQTEAIRSVTEHFESKQRKALLVMATGSGKTRTVIALCELLQRTNWAKRILFLADRRALVRQATNAFKRFMPETSPVNLLEEKEDTMSRVFVSTYPTMMSLIEESEEGKRRFGPGFFDLVVIDEAHRSVYQKYRAIFNYFDSMLVGLTATPRNEIDLNTYHLFNLESGVPTYAYELSTAVKDGFLVPPKAVSIPLKFIREGIKYDDLTDNQKEQWDEIEWNEDGEVPDEVSAVALNKWLFNTGTVDAVLEDLMTKGYRVAGGDRIGKTIIFAANHKHAEFIKKRFDDNFPHFVGKLARVIDNYEERSQQLIDDFSHKDREPHIAISVDMLDTGIDVPEVVNLVFFKSVRSRTKFHQMIGRGTRLCPDLFGPGQDKRDFLIFDYCQNFEFFNQNPEGSEGDLQESLKKRLFVHRLELVEGLQEVEPANETLSDLRRAVVQLLYGEVNSMNLENFVVWPHRKYVEKYQVREKWESLTKEEFAELATHVADLPSALPTEDETAKRFDLILLRLQLAKLGGNEKFDQIRQVVSQIGEQLEHVSNIPQVEAHLQMVQDVQRDEFWQDITLSMLEGVRKELRDLVRFIEKRSQKIIYTLFQDERGEAVPVSLPEFRQPSDDLAQYRKKISQVLREHKDNPVVMKLRYNQQVSPKDIESLEALLLAAGGVPSVLELKQCIAPQPNLLLFVRSLVGLDREAAKEAFAKYLNDQRFNSKQIAFVNQIIDDLTQNGVFAPERLYEDPFTRTHPDGLDGVFSNDSHANEIVNIIRSINANGGYADLRAS